MKTTPLLVACSMTSVLMTADVRAGNAEQPPKTTGNKEKIEKKEEEPVTNDGDWCDWLAGDPGLLYKARKRENPYFQELDIGGRLHYQLGYVSGTDVRGKNFKETHDEFRRARIETQMQFLKYFYSEANVNLVDDNRFRGGGQDLDWGYGTFDTLTVAFDFADAFTGGWFDGIEFIYGRMKLKMGEEDHQSSRRILTIERSALADKVGGDLSRPTGFLTELEKGDWKMMLGIFSGEVDEDALAGWGAGKAYYASVAWQTTKEFRLLLDLIQNDPKGGEDFLGYSWAFSLGGTYEAERWGAMANFIYGDNGGSAHGWTDPRRQGDFHGWVVMPWYWLVEERLKLVFQYQFQGSEEMEGVRIGSRYARASHRTPEVDLDSGYGDSHHFFYLGLNYYLCGHNAKIMAGISHEEMRARTDTFDATSYWVAFRTYF